MTSPNVSDSNGEVANIVDTISDLSRGVWNVSRAITPKAAPGSSADGRYVASLTEAVIGVDHSLSRIADAISDLAEAYREANQMLIMGPQGED
jgi:hypothetical protein